MTERLTVEQVATMRRIYGPDSQYRGLLALADSHEQLCADLAQTQEERDRVVAGIKALVETTTRMSCGHDGCYGESAVDDAGRWRFLHCWQCRAEAAEAERDRYKSALEAIATKRQVLDRWVSNEGIAKAALASATPTGKEQGDELL